MKYLLTVLLLAMSSVTFADEAGVVIFGGTGNSGAISASNAGVQGGSAGVIFGGGTTRANADSSNYSYGRNTTLPSGNFSSTGTVSDANGSSTTQAYGIGGAQSVFGAGAQGAGLAGGQYGNVGLGVIVSPYPSVYSH